MSQLNLPDVRLRVRRFGTGDGVVLLHGLGSSGDDWAFQVGPLAVQQTLSLFLFAFAFMMLFYGTLSDSFGRRRNAGQAEQVGGHVGAGHPGSVGRGTAGVCGWDAYRPTPPAHRP